MDQRDIFNAARRIGDPVQRAAYLDEACRDDRSCRAEVESLLEALARAGSFLEPGIAFTEPVLDPASTLDRPVTEGAGTRLGPYKLLQQIGEGGMGVVYMAEQTEPVQRRVALKIIKPGMDSRQVIARFEAERQALTMMDHPNIARVLDAGTTDAGRPYFVMELVKGVSITRYCDEHHLNPQARLELFVPVCHAVQHAHHKGIIHRDIKPSNILVAEYDDLAVPKIIDFGVAKAIGQTLTERTLFTQLGQVVGTIEYMSPEQAKLNQLDVDTRSDVYSLGVLLYELLIGESPFDQKRLRSAAFDELMRIIREEEPPKPSHRLSSSQSLPSIAANRQLEPKKLRMLMRGELDWIVMKALEKDRSRRYETANALAADIQHYLDDEPVVACPPSAAYRFRKFARRNKSLLTTIGFVAAALLLGIVLSTWQAIQKTHAEARAIRERDRANSAEQQAVADRNRAVESEKHAIEQRDKNRRLLYVSDMAVALSDWELGSVATFNELLDRHRPKPDEEDLRGFEWYYLWRNLQLSRLAPTVSQAKPLGRPVYLPDGHSLATTRADGVVQLWSLPGLEWKRDIPVVHDCTVFAPDGRTLASWGIDWSKERGGGLMVWDLGTGERVWEEHGIGQINDAAFSPDGQRLAFISGRVVKFCDVAGRKLVDASGNLIVAPEDGELTRLAFSPDGRFLAAGDWSGDLVVWDLASRQHKRLEGEGSPTTCLVFSPDSKTLASGSDDGVVRLWDIETMTQRAALTGHDNRIFCLAFSPDGSRLASSSATIKLWDPSSGRLWEEIRGHGFGVFELAFSPDGRFLASAAGGTVRLWELAAVTEKSLLQGHDGTSYSLALSPDGCTLASTADVRGIKLWDVFTGEPDGTLTGHEDVGAVVFSPDSSVLASGAADGTVVLWDRASARETMRLAEPSDRHPIFCVAVSPGGGFVASGNAIGRVKLWDAKTGALERVLGENPRSPIRSIAFAPDGAVLAFATGGNVTLWDMRSHDSIEIEGAADCGPLRFSPDGKVLAWGSNSCVRIYELERRKYRDPLPGHLGPVFDVVFTRRGDALFSGGADRTVRIWNLKTSEQRAILRSKGSYITGLVLSPCGRLLASGNADGSIRLLRIAGEEDPDELCRALRLEQRIRTIGSAAADDQKRTIAELLEGMERLGTHRMAQLVPVARSLLLCLEKGGHHELAVDASQSFAKVIQRGGAPEVQRRALPLEILPWQRYGALCAEQERWEDAAAAFTKALTLSPNDWGLRAQRGAVHVKLGRYQEAVGDFSRAIELRPSAVAMQAERGKAHAMLGHWREAAQDLLVTPDLSQELRTWETLIPLQLLAGDQDGYARTCHTAFRRYAGADSWTLAKLVLLCNLGPEPGIDRNELTRLADKALSQNNDSLMRLAKGMDDYRAGRFRQALEQLPLSSGPLRSQLAMLFSAMAYHRLGDHDQSQAMLQRAAETTETNIGSAQQGPSLPSYLPERWIVWCTIEAVRREAEQLIGEPLKERTAGSPVGEEERK